MTKNVIILTIGWTGSSVLTNLIRSAGYWTGSETHKNPDYDTYENKALTLLNERLIQESGYIGDYRLEYPPKAIDAIEKRAGRGDNDFKAFIDECNRHAPWLWKDPRLWMTIRFWAHYLDFRNVQFIMLTRDDFQTWISCNLRRQILSHGYITKYNARIVGSLELFLTERDALYHHVSYDDLITKPNETLDELNKFLGTSLELKDLEKVYNKPLFKNPRGLSDFLKALMIYVKNYGDRLDKSLTVDRSG